MFNLRKQFGISYSVNKNLHFFIKFLFNLYTYTQINTNDFIY